MRTAGAPLVWPGPYRPGRRTRRQQVKLLRVQTAHAPPVEKVLYQAGPEEVLARAAWPTKDRGETRLGVETHRGEEAARTEEQKGAVQVGLE